MLAVVAGTMTAAADDDEIILLSYIKSTGQQAFNTNYIHKSHTMVMMACEIEQDHQRNYEALFGARLSNFHNNALCFFSRFNGQDVPCYNRSGVETQGSGLPYNRYVEVVATGQMAAWGSDADGMLGSITTTGTADDGITPMLIFNLNTSNTPGGVQIDTSPSCVTLYEFKIYEGDYNLIHSFLPAKKNGVVGLYDRLTGSFSGSITDTPFLAGEETDVLYPVYVQYNEGGTVRAEFPAYSKESWGGFYVTQNEGYEIKSIEVKDAEGNNLEYTLAKQEGLEGVYFFQMPASKVTVNVVFQKPLEGDVNADTVVDIADVVKILSIMAEIGDDETDLMIQRLGMWYENNLKSAISEAEWAELAVKKAKPIGRLHVGIKYGIDGTNVAMSVAAKTKDKIFVSAIDCRPTREGNDWIVNFLKNAEVDDVVADGTSAQLLQDKLDEEKVGVELIRPTVREYCMAGAVFEQALESKTIEHEAQPSVDEVTAHCAKRLIGKQGGWGYKSLDEEHEIALLDSIVLAHWLCLNEKPKKAMKVWY